jgi:hypothetical protein
MQVNVGLNQAGNEENVIQVYPNPATQQCNVSFNFANSSQVTITLEDLSGKRIRTMNKQNYLPGKQTTVIDLSGIPNGLYFVKLTNNDKSYYQKVVIKN